MRSSVIVGAGQFGDDPAVAEDDRRGRTGRFRPSRSSTRGRCGPLRPRRGAWRRPPAWCRHRRRASDRPSAPPARGGQRAGEQHLLLVAARQRQDRVATCRRCGCRCARASRRDARPRCAPVDEAARATGRGSERDRHVRAGSTRAARCRRVPVAGDEGHLRSPCARQSTLCAQIEPRQRLGLAVAGEARRARRSRPGRREVRPCRAGRVSCGAQTRGARLRGRPSRRDHAPIASTSPCG